MSPIASGRLNEMLAALERGFGVRFAAMDGASGQLLAGSPQQLLGDWSCFEVVCREVARRGLPEFIYDEDPLVILAIPLTYLERYTWVAVGAFLSRPLRDGETFPASINWLGISPKEALDWAKRQSAWSPDALVRMAELTLSEWSTAQRLRKLEKESESLSKHLTNTYEEICLLHRLAQNLKLSHSDEELGQVALDWLREVVPAKAVAIQFLPVAEKTEDILTRQGRTEPVLLTTGECPITEEQLACILKRHARRADHQPLVLNSSTTTAADWPAPLVRQMVAVPLAESDRLFGWLLAINHNADGEFGTIEANLLSSVAAILGIHSGNIDLYRQQAELLAGVVRALTSAIDAKDPYTCGHSDRVAQLAVRLAKELGVESQNLERIYLSGLLHDIGKIGIDDVVLRKPDKLTDAEFQHIKQHVEIGHRILVDLKKLGDVLPVVLHHHESWDGSGYPHALSMEEIPFSARIVAVADAYDAMASDRPYRKGMPEAKIDDIFRSGAGKQWDPQIVEAFTRARDDLREIVRMAESERKEQALASTEVGATA